MRFIKFYCYLKRLFSTCRRPSNLFVGSYHRVLSNHQEIKITSDLQTHKGCISLRESLGFLIGQVEESCFLGYDPVLVGLKESKNVFFWGSSTFEDEGAVSVLNV
jgi:hypothetical protein